MREDILRWGQSLECAKSTDSPYVVLEASKWGRFAQGYTLYVTC